MVEIFDYDYSRKNLKVHKDDLNIGQGGFQRQHVAARFGDQPRITRLELIVPVLRVPTRGTLPQKLYEAESEVPTATRIHIPDSIALF